MNNFINFAKKQQRNGLERGILAEIRKTYPHAEQYLSGHRYPTLPKIVVYSASSSSDSFLQSIFPFYSLITPSLTAQNDEVIARRVAEELTQVQDNVQNSQNTRFGYLLKGFPFNTSQALLLDRYLNGVNLALHLRSQEQSGDYLSSIESLLSYYRERGTLLELNHSAEPTLAELESAMDEIRIHIKRPF